MNKRTIVLCASVGTLVLSAAHAPVLLERPGTDSSISSAAESCARVRESEPVRSAGHARSANSTQSSQPTEASLAQLSAAYGSPDSTRETTAPSPAEVDEPTLWLARVIYSETKLRHEQELVAWVVRNRVETAYRGKSTYREVILDPYQFSAFNPGSSKRSLLMHLEPETPLPRWKQALWIAYYVRHADPIYRPFSRQTRHFFSERSMMGRPKPFWARRHRFVSPGRDYQVDERRFRFYEGISS
ncbi:MAG: hypothetical protein BRD42_10715 [Bacteroidetes bacterium QS_3_64_15]|nr:MAG: hypothetical protein BRD42_10715 [Bacteroidetes bacterium QS_3_64_15]